MWGSSDHPSRNRRWGRKAAAAPLTSILLGLAAAVVSAGCSTGHIAKLEARYERDVARCTGRPLWPPSIPDQLEPRLSIAQVTALTQVVPPEVRRVARAGRLEHVLAELVLAHLDPEKGELASEALLAHVTLQNYLRTLSVELTGARFEIDCLGDQLESLHAGFAMHESDREGALTILSIAVGALAGIGSGAWELSASNSDGPAWLGIAGGVASAGFGIAALLPARIEANLSHPRNPLTPIWTGRDPKRIFSTFVWRLLGSIPVGTDETPRERLVAHWREIITAAVEPTRIAALEALLFGEGGVYDEKALQVREALLDALETELDGMHRELERLNRFVRRLDAVVAPASPLGDEHTGENAGGDE